jgi:succinoglycan biosynthesis transport protein ExoP
MTPARKASSTRGSAEKEAAPVSLDYDHLWRLCVKYWPLLATAVVVGALAGYLYGAFQTTIYSATATIVVPGREGGIPSGEDVGKEDVTSGDLINTFVQLLQTKDLPSRVTKSQHLNENPEFLPEGVAAPVSEDQAASILAQDVSIHIRPATRLIDITVEHHSPTMAQSLANWLAQESISEEFDQDAGDTTMRTDHLQKEVERLQQKASASEQALKSYENAHNIVSSGSSQDPEDVADTRLKDLNQQLSNAQAQVTLLRERYGEEHPRLIQAEQMVQELGDEVDKAKAEAGKSSVADAGFTTLKSEADSDQTQFDIMNKELHAAETSIQVATPELKVVDEATSAILLRPNKPKTAAAGGFFGLICGLGFILGVYFIDTSIRTVSQAESTLSLPVIAAVPIMTESTAKSVLPTFSHPQSFAAEAFRGLRASLILQDREHPLKTVLVVSAVPGEGKSFCAANLGVAFAQAGLRTLLIDADLRLPTLYTYFELARREGANGFADVLAGRVALASAVTASAIPNLDLLLTTVAADSPAELLSGVRLPLLLNEASAKYDRIVIDSAPLNAVSDTMLILPEVNAILLVIRAAQTPASECKSALAKIYSTQIKPLGLILNYLAPHTMKSYAYGYSYGQKPKEKSAR